MKSFDRACLSTFVFITDQDFRFSIALKSRAPTIARVSGSRGFFERVFYRFRLICRDATERDEAKRVSSSRIHSYDKYWRTKMILLPSDAITLSRCTQPVSHPESYRQCS